MVRKITCREQKRQLLRVAAYARVSSGKDAQLESLAAQVDHFSRFIQEQPGWEYVGVYSDEAYTGTKDKRPGFQSMLADCRAGKIDMILVKAISRFSRNTVPTLTIVRELTDMGVDVFFQQENIHTLSGDGELMLSILASYAQEESLSVSENVKWRIRKQFADGIPMGLGKLYGYRVKKGAVSIIEDEAAVVRGIFEAYAGGSTCGEIVDDLIATHAPRREGMRTTRCVRNLLQNEKYAGNALMQKTYVSDHLTKRKVQNRGALPQYFVKGSHPAIVTQALFDQVQQRMAAERERFTAAGAPKHVYAFTSKVRCGCCGRNYKRKLNHGYLYWQCQTHLEVGGERCLAPSVPNYEMCRMTAEVLGLPDFDEAAFEQQIDHITITASKEAVFFFRDGREARMTWEGHNRRERSTTP